MSMSRDVAVAVCEHLLLLNLPLLQMFPEGLTFMLPFLLLALFLLPLALLAISRLVPHRNEDFLPPWLALASGTCPVMPMEAPAASWCLPMLPGWDFSTFVWVHGCRGLCSFSLSPHVVAGIHLPSGHWRHTAMRSG